MGGKNGFLTPKAIANRIKAKGLQRLRWYCQLCRKQCRDENGFKCHQMSDSHRRQFELFGHNPERFVDGYSEEFEEQFLDHLKRGHPQTRVSANVVYNEFISDRHHVHMNSTKWLTLTEFVKYLGRTGKCRVEETPKGWFMQLIPRDDIEGIRAGNKRKREEHEREDDERQLRELEEQIRRAEESARGPETDSVEGRELVREEGAGPLSFSMPGFGGTKAALEKGGKGEDRSGGNSASPVVGDDDREEGGEGARLGGGKVGKGASKLEEIMRSEMAAKSRREPVRADHWLQRGIVVKVLSEGLKEHGYYNEKGVVEAVVDRYVGEIRMLRSGDVVRVDQEQLETVLPKTGGRVLVVNGAYRGQRGVLLGIDTDKYKAEVELQVGAGRRRKVWLEYEDVCKLDHQA
eukprot:evm.model.scf_128EXC.13 EVM.evm.TU.scf_128EXC.13   scf_128EXC:99599-100813(+)